MKYLTNARVVSSGRVFDASCVAINDDTIESVGAEAKVSGVDLNNHLLVPGFVDMHVHGAAGYSFGSGNASQAIEISHFHLIHGTTTMLGGISSDEIPHMVHSARGLSPLCDTGDLAGLFYEGPFLSLERRGAHDPEHLRQPDRALLQELVAAGSGTVKLVTIAPELPDGIDLIRDILGAGSAAAIGHTNADYDQAKAAFDAGARIATHLFNGMPALHHRAPGPVLAAMEDDRVTCELISDGFHVDDAMIRFVFDSIGSGRVALVTDAIDATGVGDGVYHSAGSTTVVTNGLAMLQDGSSIAGSTLTMEKAVRRTVLRVGVGLPDAIRAATETPARALGISNVVGSIAPGMRANFAVLDDDLRVTAVMRSGRWVSGPWMERI